MKRTALIFTIVLVFVLNLRADDKQAQIDALQLQLDTAVAHRTELAAPIKDWSDKMDNNKFAYDAYIKQNDILKQEVQSWTAKAAENKRQVELLEPALENYNQRVTQHNSHQCTEKCTQGGGCDGSCGWYTAEKAQLDANKQQLDQAYAPVDAQAKALESERQQLSTNLGLSDTLWTNIKNTDDQLRQQGAQLKADWDANELRIANLQRQLDVLKGFNQACLSQIPPACANPNTNELVTQCEKMHAACGSAFDGNK